MKKYFSFILRALIVWSAWIWDKPWLLSRESSSWQQGSWGIEAWALETDATDANTAKDVIDKKVIRDIGSDSGTLHRIIWIWLTLMLQALLTSQRPILSEMFLLCKLQNLSPLCYRTGEGYFVVSLSLGFTTTWYFLAFSIFYW